MDPLIRTLRSEGPGAPDWAHWAIAEAPGADAPTLVRPPGGRYALTDGNASVTHFGLRRRLLLEGPPAPASVTADAGPSEPVTGELADARGTLAPEVVRDGYGGL
ncbi:hypothetical protein M2164_003412 [Streptomyces sp. SAI-208]|uniref:hypothetical protein n=1 Tax=unclassified Streptomyces TaxID=2593676 RepID=UPI002475D408|nr:MULTISPECIES: hypothetical protein [unclassified Streptomyces]MDH6516956.1 hypothetical protein [Streptomyces sp. SAI-090]MDH6549171.1 hypothetical protein [Streptomyces sp. SAI-041]MDH6568238.1 hypothetical protein [Streptomyces sp. SAI-117]MDH6586813.1 hypothetical protein [Streptomyces sp. SAI-133]MDH6607777.1 hypothetical protein [Streptomyces sp. SAI-208]